MKIGTVYCIQNKTTKKNYVGSTRIAIKIRFWNHTGSLNQGNHHSRKLQTDWNKQGPKSFIFKVLEVCDLKNLLQREQFWMNKLRAPTEGYNSHVTAGNATGYKLPKDVIQNMMRKNPNLSKIRSMTMIMVNKRPDVRASRSKHFKKLANTPEAIARSIKKIQKVNADPIYKTKLRERLRKQNADPEFQKKALAARLLKLQNRSFT